MTIKELCKKLEHADSKQKHEVWEIIGEVFGTIETKFPAYYDKYYKKIKSVFDDEYDGYGMTEDQAKMYVEEMKNKDGSTGEHFDCATICRAIEMYPKLDKYHFWDLYYVMNMMYSDYYDSSFTTKTYIKLAEDFLDDKDAPKNKALIYAKAMHEEHHI